MNLSSAGSIVRPPTDSLARAPSGVLISQLSMTSPVVEDILTIDTGMTPKFGWISFNNAYRYPSP